MVKELITAVNSIDTFTFQKAVTDLFYGLIFLIEVYIKSFPAAKIS